MLYQVEAPLDPTKELARLISERKYEEAFIAALHRSDVSIVSWLCAQVCQRMMFPYFAMYLVAVVQCVIDHWENHSISAKQVDLHGHLSRVPLPLSQGVLLSLLQQLACDINNDPPRKIAWMTDVAAAIDPSDPMISVHVRPIFEQVYQILNHQRSVPTMTGADLSSIRLLLHVINSMLTTCKWFFSSFPEICANSPFDLNLS